jgi:transposase-like protein
MGGEQTTLEQDGPIRSSHKSGHMTARTQRIELITRGERRRRWSIEEKREIVAESQRPGVRPSEIIQRHGITSGQLYAWRQNRTAGPLPLPPAAAPWCGLFGGAFTLRSVTKTFSERQGAAPKGIECSQSAGEHGAIKSPDLDQGSELRSRKALGRRTQARRVAQCLSGRGTRRLRQDHREDVHDQYGGTGYETRLQGRSHAAILASPLHELTGFYLAVDS